MRRWISAGVVLATRSGGSCFSIRGNHLGGHLLDVAFDRQKLAIEIDGRLHEDDPDVFERDRWRQNVLVLEGWRVLRFTWRMLKQDPDFVVRTVHAALDLKI